MLRMFHWFCFGFSFCWLPCIVACISHEGPAFCLEASWNFLLIVQPTEISLNGSSVCWLTSSSAWSCLRGCWELLLFRRPGSAGVLNRTPWEKKYFHREQDYKISVPDDIMSHYWIIWWLRICQLSPQLGWIWNESLHLLRWRWIQAVAFSLEGPFKVYYTNSNLVSKTFRKKHVGWFWYTQKDGKN